MPFRLSRHPDADVGVLLGGAAEPCRDEATGGLDERRGVRRRERRRVVDELAGDDGDRRHGIDRAGERDRSGDSHEGYFSVAQSRFPNHWSARAFSQR